jgi:hypothetical protein
MPFLRYYPSSYPFFNSYSFFLASLALLLIYLRLLLLAARLTLLKAGFLSISFGYRTFFSSIELLKFAIFLTRKDAGL